MTNQSEAARLAEMLRGFTQRQSIIQQPSGEFVKQPHSLRWIESATQGELAHQRLSEFLRNPERATPQMLDRVSNLLGSEALQDVFVGDRVTYFDFPAYRAGLAQDVIDELSPVAFRLITPTDEVGYNGFRSSGWMGDLSRIDEIAAAAPGGWDKVTRIVFDTGAA